MKNKLYNWSLKPSKDRILKSIKKGIQLHITDGFFEKISIKRILKTLKHNLVTLLIITSLISSNIYFYRAGTNSKNSEIESLENNIKIITKEYNVQTDLLSGEKYTSKELKNEIKRITSSRVYLTAVINKEASVEIPERVSDEHLNLMFEQANKYDLPYTVFFRVIQKESRYKWWVQSSAGAKGYMQVMPSTYKSIAKDIGLPLEMTPESNIMAGSYYLRKKYNEQFNKIIHKKVYEKYEIDLSKKVNKLSKEELELYEKECEIIKKDTSYYNNHNTYIWELALSAYNAGSSKVKYSVPNITETKNYVKFILNPYYGN